ncbi:MAG: DNA internalization-related competence protein ComEC/Rec2 [Candidatus Cloacimonetes bacterium]|nr:DNA internalization-related competence protein ComEC/Rec2 [Candidatus Cloacimonadota bacterium]MBL7085481.1 DNA internalization-related competence protein ComEC/Rec2 [Candidatus Cloacimonadota bacterium]
MEKISNKPFIPITFFFTIGIVFSENIYISFMWYLALFICSLLFLLFSKVKPTYILFFLLILFGAFRFSISSNHPTNHISKIINKLGNEKLNISGFIDEEPIYHSGKTRFVLSIQKIEETEICGKILVRVNGKSYANYGDRISIYASIQKPYKNNNPYSFNYKEYLENKGIYATAFIYSNSITIENQTKNLYSILVIGPRKWLRNRIDNLFSQKYAGFIKAILLGEKDALDKNIKEDFANSGLSHILAVSGLHTGVIALILLTILQVIIRKRNLARILTILALLYYVLLSHSAPSVQRAVIMISLLLFSKILQRKTENVNILFAAGFIILLINPQQIFSVGFQFSFLSVFAILVIYPIFSRVIYGLYEKYKPAYWLLNLMMISFVVQLVLAPLTVYYFHKIAFGGIIANVIAIPIISIILPLSILAIFFPLASINVYYIAANRLLLNLLFSISNFVSYKRILLFDFLNVEIWQVIFVFIIFVLLILIWKEKNRISRKFVYILTSTFLIFGLIFLPAFLYSPRVELTILDVQTGDAIFLKTPSKKNILIDTGNKTNKIDFGEKVVLPFLQSKQVRKLDLLVLTHPHADHIGGAGYLLDKIKIKSILMPECEYNSSLYYNLCRKIEAKNIEVIYADTSLAFDEFSQMKIKLLFPYSEFSTKNINNYSIVLKCEYKDFSFILTGDAEKEVENWLCEKYSAGLDIDVLKVCHHGSNTSSTNKFLELTSPEFGAISVGKFNRYGLPSDKTLDRLHKHNVRFFRTDEDGAIIFSSDGEDLKIKTILSEKEIFITDI